MDEFDVIIIGGGIAGSVAAKFSAKSGLKTLFVEKYKTPREKPCSGIQFGYFEKILDEKIPKERLCNVKLNKVRMYLPNGKSIVSPFPMLNFMRKPFDHWLNQIAQQNGALFKDECEIKDFKVHQDYVLVKLYQKEEKEIEYKTKYLIDATGLRPKIRMMLHPEDFIEKPSGSTLNYYIEGTSKMNPHTLYQFWNMDWNDAMFAWVYMKTLEDGKDYWVVGTGCRSGKLLDRQTKFYNYICDKFDMKGTIIKKEGFSSNIDLGSKDRIWLGQDRILMVGDAAGFIDQVRGVGMDAAALSGRLAAKAILTAETNKTKAIDEYNKLAQKLVKQTRRNQSREITDFTTNEQLQKYLYKNMVKMGTGLVFQAICNKFRNAENVVMLPP